MARKSLVLLSTCCLRVAFNRAWVDERWKRGESSWFFSRGKSRNLILRFYKNSVRISARRPAGLNFNLDTRWQRTTTSFPSFYFIDRMPIFLLVTNGFVLTSFYTLPFFCFLCCIIYYSPRITSKWQISNGARPTLWPVTSAIGSRSVEPNFIQVLRPAHLFLSMTHWEDEKQKGDCCITVGVGKKRPVRFYFSCIEESERVGSSAFLLAGKTAGRWLPYQKTILRR